MGNPQTTSLDLAIARTRILVSLVALISLYVDPNNGGFLGIEPFALAALLAHLGYSTSAYVALRHGSHVEDLATMSVTLDVCFATILAVLTEGKPTSPAIVFFMFAIVYGGCRFSVQTCFGVTIISVILYLMVITIGLHRVSDLYVMRAAYLGVAGYLVGFLGYQRGKFQARVHELENAAERKLIARDLHDGYVQALAAINLRIGACLRWLDRDGVQRVSTELREMQVEVTREYDEVRRYIHSLADTRYSDSRPGSELTDGARFCAKMEFTVDATIAEHVLQIVLEGLRNARRHGTPRLIAAKVEASPEALEIVIDDDGQGFGEIGDPPWSIASRVAEVGGEIEVLREPPVGGHLRIQIPHIE